MTTPTRKSELLRRQLKASSLVRCVGVHDALSARIGQEEGFDAVWASGLCVSSVHGVPDANILGIRDMLDACWTINRAVDLPVIADCDTGFGDAGVARHMVREFERAGVAAVCMEDKVFPKLNSFAEGRQELAPLRQFAGKIAAAKDAQRSSAFFVIARVEALIAGLDVGYALERAYAYAEAGADAILIHSKARTPHEILSFVEQWDGRVPLVLVPTTYPSLNASELEALGKVGIVIYANQALRASILAMRRALAAIRRTGSTVSIEEEIASVREVFALQDMPEFLEIQAHYADWNQPPAVLGNAAAE